MSSYTLQVLKTKEDEIDYVKRIKVRFQKVVHSDELWCCIGCRCCNVKINMIVLKSLSLNKFVTVILCL